MEKKTQLNVRVRPPYVKAARVAAAVIGEKQEQVVELAFRFLVGVEDEESRKMRCQITKAWKAMGEPLPFNYPTHRLASALN